MSNLTILNKAIRQSENLFSLNDLHRAGGGESKHQPAFFVRLDTTQDLISEIQKEDPNFQPLKSINGGANRGTYACKEIVIAYAAWISPQFHLVVLRAFLDKLENSQNSQQNLPLATAEKFIDIHISESDIRELAWIWFAGQQMADFISNLIRPLELLGSTDAPRAYSYANEYGNLLSGSIDLIEQLTKGVHFDNPTPLKRLKQAKEYREHRRKMVLNSREMVERATQNARLGKR